jgi:SAM-dependent methyltransferase
VTGFDEFFGDDYLWFWDELLPPERSDEEADLIWRLLELEPGAEALDLACGHGRIANRLAHRGARVTGLDSSSLFLERARADAAELGVEVDYVHGDMRSIPWHDRFDAAVNWFTAFGYHADDELHAILRDVRTALRPDPLRGGIDAEFVVIRGGEVRRHPGFIRNPSFTELRDWLHAAGFAGVEGYGEDGEPLTSDHRRMLVLARA